jgi:thioredoxin 1
MTIKYVTTIEEFNQTVSESKFACVDFYADWCGPCKKLAEELHKLEGLPNFNIIKINVDSAQELAELYNITSLPTVKVFQNGKEVLELLGYNSGHIETIKKYI